jgi:ribosomal protein L37AE/L43A
MSERAAPFYCPYCADEDLRPFGETHGQWRCGACQRVYALKYIGIAADWTTDPVNTVGPAHTDQPMRGAQQ